VRVDQESVMSTWAVVNILRINVRSEGNKEQHNSTASTSYMKVLYYLTQCGESLECRCSPHQ
jgi:hypothetical protein